jgi:CHASE3 domain sensor protein
VRVALAAARGTIRGRLVLGFATVVSLLVLAGVFARLSMSAASADVSQTLVHLQRDARLTSTLSANIAQEIDAASAYLLSADSAAQEDFRRRSRDVHAVQRTLLNLPEQTPDEVATAATMERKLSDVEVHFALAHRLMDLGRTADAGREAALAHEQVSELLTALERWGVLKTGELVEASHALNGQAERRSWPSWWSPARCAPSTDRCVRSSSTPGSSAPATSRCAPRRRCRASSRSWPAP